MGLGDVDYLDGGGGGGGKVSAASVSCSICLDVVTDNGDRSWAKLQCGHKFHLDCIGSAFNVKGAMQCPNCRKIEKGQWLYANGNRPLPEISMDDWTHDDDLYDLGYSEMSFGVHWCPFSGLTRLPSSFYEGDFSTTAYPELIAHHAVYAEHTPASSTSHPCPYIAYFGPIHPSSSASSISVSDGSSFNNHWSGPSIPSEVSNSYGFPSMDLHYQSWDHSSPFATNNRVSSAEQSIPSMTQRGATRTSSDPTRPGMHPFILGRSSTGRAPSSVTSSVLPRYPGTTARPHDRSLQAHFLQATSNPAGRTSGLSSRRRSSNLRGLAQAIPPTSSPPDQSSGFHFFSSSSSGRAFQEPENPLHEHYNAWDREHQPSFHVNQVDRGDSIWGPFHPPALVSDTGIRLGSYRQRHGSERMPSQNRS